MPKTEITYKPVDVDEKATHGDYKHLCQRWEGLTPGTAKVWAGEMREHPDFKQFIDNPTHKIVCSSNGKVVIAIARRKKLYQKCLRISIKKNNLEYRREEICLNHH